MRLPGSVQHLGTFLSASGTTGSGVVLATGLGAAVSPHAAGLTAHPLNLEWSWASGVSPSLLPSEIRAPRA